MDIFISYSSKEYSSAKKIKEYLDSNDISCWMAPDSIPEGSNYTKEIPMVIYKAKAFLILLSENSQNSPWVDRELEVAIKSNKPIIAYAEKKVKLINNFTFNIKEDSIIKAYNEENPLDLLIKTINEALLDESEEKNQENQDIKRDGKGKMTFPDGRVYEGEWKNREINGYGIMRYPDGVIYEGEWLDEKFEGHGKIVTPQGITFEGEWTNNHKVGHFKETNSKGQTFYLECSYDHEANIGTELYQTDVYYEGSMKNGLRNGKGKFYEKGGRYYEGDWVNGLKHGKGRENYENGTYYEGEWKYGLRDGKGKETYLDGSRYEGEWKEDKKCGQGTLYNYMGLTVYKGLWENDKKLGKIKSFFKRLKEIFWS